MRVVFFSFNKFASPQVKHIPVAIEEMPTLDRVARAQDNAIKMKN